MGHAAMPFLSILPFWPGQAWRPVEWPEACQLLGPVTLRPVLRQRQQANPHAFDFLQYQEPHLKQELCGYANHQLTKKTTRCQVWL